MEPSYEWENLMKGLLVKNKLGLDTNYKYIYLRLVLSARRIFGFAVCARSNDFIVSQNGIVERQNRVPIWPSLAPLEARGPS